MNIDATQAGSLLLSQLSTVTPIIWDSMKAQIPIWLFTELFAAAAVLTLAIFTIIAGRALDRHLTPTTEFELACSEWGPFERTILTAIVVLIAGACVFSVCVKVPMIYAAFFNQDYWVLMTLLQK